MLPQPFRRSHHHDPAALHIPESPTPISPLRSTKCPVCLTQFQKSTSVSPLCQPCTDMRAILRCYAEFFDKPITPAQLERLLAEALKP